MGEEGKGAGQHRMRRHGSEGVFVLCICRKKQTSCFQRQSTLVQYGWCWVKVRDGGGGKGSSLCAEISDPTGTSPALEGPSMAPVLSVTLCLSKAESALKDIEREKSSWFIGGHVKYHPHCSTAACLLASGRVRNREHRDGGNWTCMLQFGAPTGVVRDPHGRDIAPRKRDGVGG